MKDRNQVRIQQLDDDSFLVTEYVADRMKGELLVTRTTSTTSLKSALATTKLAFSDTVPAPAPRLNKELQ